MHHCELTVAGMLYVPGGRIFTATELEFSLVLDFGYRL